MDDHQEPERFDVVVVGGGQAGLAMGHELRRCGLRLVILDANARIGDSWRHRYEGLRLFTPARYDGLPGLRFPAPPSSCPTKDEVADYLEGYARTMALPVRSGVRVEAVRRGPGGGGFVIATAGGRRIEAGQVVVATGAYHAPRIPAVAAELDPAIRQLHAIDYRDASQLQPGDVAVVGASNTGAEIAMTAAAAGHRVVLVGRDTGRMPTRPGTRLARLIDPPFWFFLNHVVRMDGPIGRRARPQVRDRGGPLERIWPADLAAAGIERITARVEGVVGGRSRLGDGRTLDVANIVWATGYRPSYDWLELDLPTDDDGWPVHRRGVVDGIPGLYLLGLPFLWTGGSALLGGVGRDAAHLGRAIERRAAASRATAEAGPVAGERVPMPAERDAEREASTLGRGRSRPGASSRAS